MKFGRPLGIIVHYTVQFNLGCCKSSVSDMDLNTILNMLNILSYDVLKVKFKRFPTYNHYEFGVLQKLCVGHWPKYYFEHVKHIIKRRLKREKKIPTYNPYKIR